MNKTTELCLSWKDITYDEITVVTNVPKHYVVVYAVTRTRNQWIALDFSFCSTEMILLDFVIVERDIDIRIEFYEDNIVIAVIFDYVIL